MRLIENIGSETEQRHTVLFEESEITIILRYYAVIETWFLQASYKDFTVAGVGLSVGTLHIESRNQPFDFLVQDTSGSGLDPFRASDFEEGRTRLYILDPDDMTAIRGSEVQL